ncbi:MAG: hypothetical protein AAGU27_28435 [Dehalobacterium sp.]
MFEIKYRITYDINEIKNWNAEKCYFEGDFEGFFALNFNGNWYGYYHENVLREGEEGFELISRWFEDLLRAFINLKNSNYVAVSDIESYNTWFEFRKVNTELKVSVIETKDKSGYDSIEENLFEDSLPTDWGSSVVSFEEFGKELLLKAESYIKEVEEINSALVYGKRISQLIALVEKARGILS